MNDKPVERWNPFPSEPHRMRLRNGIRTVNGITGETEPTYGEYVLASDYDALAARLADWQRECGPLLEFLTGAPELCGMPVEYAQELQESLVEIERERDEAREAIQSTLNDLERIGTGTTHWQNCEESHPLCAIAKRLRAALGLRDKVTEQGDRLPDCAALGAEPAK